VAYVPFLFLTGDTGTFLYSLPVVIGCALVASRLVSMTFIPLLGYYLLRPKAEKSIEERRKSGFASWYYRVGIVLFDFIEERHEQGEPLREALLDAGIIRLRPVLITVAATVIALFPLAAHGGPLWEPLCYAQIGGSRRPRS
jgi:multidrug efflux pump subunit AcrB